MGEKIRPPCPSRLLRLGHGGVGTPTPYACRRRVIHHSRLWLLPCDLATTTVCERWGLRCDFFVAALVVSITTARGYRQNVRSRTGLQVVGDRGIPQTLLQAFDRTSQGGLESVHDECTCHPSFSDERRRNEASVPFCRYRGHDART